jgi:hypothetical protein
MSSYPVKRKDSPVPYMISFIVMVGLVPLPAHVLSYATMGTSNLPPGLFPFLQGYSNASLLSECPPMFLQDISSNKTSSNLSAHYSSKYPASNAIDNNDDTRWTSIGNGSSLTLNLGSPSRICDIGVTWYLGGNRSYNFVLEVSNDSLNFVRIYENRSSGTTNSTEIYHMPDVNATTLRLIVNGSDRNSYAHVSELRLYVQA